MRLDHADNRLYDVHYDIGKKLFDHIKHAAGCHIYDRGDIPDLQGRVPGRLLGLNNRIESCFRATPLRRSCRLTF